MHVCRALPGSRTSNSKHQHDLQDQILIQQGMDAMPEITCAERAACVDKGLAQQLHLFPNPQSCFVRPENAPRA